MYIDFIFNYILIISIFAINICNCSHILMNINEMKMAIPSKMISRPREDLDQPELDQCAVCSVSSLVPPVQDTYCYHNLS